ncbi:vitamin K epoxide reductase family protein [Frigoriglobus tundricola]|nr:vitamin K epoxide reductase family protein [Frigoriglobus tundricola]
MRANLLFLRVVLLVSILGSAASLADDSFDTAPFCGFESACDAVTGTEYGRPLGLPLAAVGLAAFGVLFALALFPTARSFVLVGPLAVLGGVCGLGLIGIQSFVLERFCPLCLLVDGCAVAGAVITLRGRVWRAAGTEMSRWGRAAWAAGAIVAAAGPFLVGLMIQAGEPPVPDVVAAQWTDGAVTLVEMTDFDCYACRQSEPILAEFRRAHPEVRFVRLVAPGPAHTYARPTGRAYLAARAQGKGEEMARLLLATSNCGPDQCRQLAVGLGLDMTKYDQAIIDPATEAEMDVNIGAAMTAGTGLPMVWVQGARIQGVPNPATLALALKRAQAARGG